MTISEYTLQLQQQIRERATSIAREDPDRLSFIGKMISFTMDQVIDLKQFTCKYVFNGPAEEIQFFKELKPVLLSQYFFYKKLLSVHIYDSYKNNEAKKVYYIYLLTRLERFLRRNNRFYIYCVTGQTHYDEKYFRRNTGPHGILTDGNFSTMWDIKLARLLANELLRSEIILYLDRVSTKDKSIVHWTGRKSDAVELLFALQASGCINSGQVEIKKLATAFEQLFNVQFGNYYDFVKKIRMRKGNRTVFLDALKNKFLARLEQMDE